MFQSFVAVGEWANFGWQCLRSGLSSFRRPNLVLPQLHHTFIGALPLAIVAGLALGAVIWMHTHTILARTGTEEFMPTMLSVAVLLELAPIGAGLILAARSGAAIGAELGAMKITEQIDALELLGVPAQQRLVGPRVLACMIAMPLLHVFIATLAIGSGFLAENVVNGTTWLSYESAFLTGNRSELYLREVIPAALKTIVFGYVVAVAGCYYGLRAVGGTEGVGQATTRSVVAAALGVMLADVILVGMIQILIG